MPEDISILEKEEIIYINSKGNIKLDDLFHSYKSVMQINSDKNLDKVLVDAREQTSLPSLIALYVFGEKLSQHFQHVKHAIVVSPKSPKDLGFIETVSKNRGVNIKIFNSIDLTLAWLNNYKTPNFH
jgi:hypothetical protein